MTDSFAMLAVVALIAVILARFMDQQRQCRKNEPPWLSETIPFVSNAWQFMTDKESFIERLREAFKESNIVQCRLGPMKMYYITGGRNTSALFRSSFHSEPWIERIVANTAGYTALDVAKMTKDRTGPARERIWYSMHRGYEENLSNARAVGAFAAKFQALFAQALSGIDTNTNKGNDGDEGYEEIRVLDFLKHVMGGAATRAVFGDKIFEVNPDLLEAYWEWDKSAETLAFGLPKWMNRRGVGARNRVRDMCTRWLEAAGRETDWGVEEKRRAVEWEPVYGSGLSRGLVRWGKAFGFSGDSMGAAIDLAILGLNSNTVAVCTWVMMELAKDPILLQEVREEVSRAVITTGPDSGQLNCQQLLALPLLQSVFTECLRLHIRVLITRTSTEPVTVSGYHLPKGSYFQAPTQAAHLDETAWGRPGHPASGFWARRHLKEVTVKDDTGSPVKKTEFYLSGAPGEFFPYGGGISRCSGQGFAKHEIPLVVGLMVTKFDLEFVGWIKHDGSASDRPAKDDAAYANAVAALPDRDMKVRLRRRVS
ncbi:hypothetical protein PG997_013626 [Apiospora hydei]|uniref:Cytochrome P450 n=1 Tax=Apiospora hydei TaxID=1337664 RepID=A0ABR1V6Q9_9PEZI